MVDILIIIAFAVSTLATITRLSWSPRGTGLAALAILIGLLPPSAGDAVAGLSQGRVMDWLAAPETGKSLSLLFVAESLISGAFAFRILSRPSSHLARGMLAVTPSPAMVLCLLGVQMIAFNRVSGVEFASLSWGMAAGVAALVGGGAWALRRSRPLERRAEHAIRLAAAQFLLGSALPLLLRPPQTQPGVGRIDLVATALAPATLLGIAALGMTWRLARTRLSPHRPQRRRLA